MLTKAAFILVKIQIDSKNSNIVKCYFKIKYWWFAAEETPIIIINHYVYMDINTFLNTINNLPCKQRFVITLIGLKS